MIYNRRTITTITPPVGFAVSVADMKTYLVIEGAQDDALLGWFIAAAQEAIRRYLRRGILPETVEMRMDGFPGYNEDGLVRLGAGVHNGHRASLIGTGAEFDLPYGPVASVTSITTFNRANVSAVFSAAAYSVDRARVYLNDGWTWPTDLRARDAVRVVYVIGSAIVPEPIKQAIRQHVAAMYECRDACDIPPGCKAILAGYRRIDDMGFA